MRAAPSGPGSTSGRPSPQAPRTCGDHSFQRSGRAMSAQASSTEAAESAAKVRGITPGSTRAPGCGCARTEGVAAPAWPPTSPSASSTPSTPWSPTARPTPWRSYADGATSGNVATTRTYEGPDGAKAFWTGYREAFGEIRSEFRNVVGDDAAALLEWESRGTLSNGDEVVYEGVTVLELDGERITRSTAYFDPRAIVEHLSRVSA